MLPLEAQQAASRIIISGSDGTCSVVKFLVTRRERSSCRTASGCGIGVAETSSAPNVRPGCDKLQEALGNSS